jgi:hypothetical protein
MALASIRSAALAVLVAISTGVQAAPVVTQSPDQAFGANMSFAMVADNFSLGGGPGASYDITNLRFWSLQSAAADYTGSVYWAIHADASGSMGAVLHSNVAAVAGSATGAFSLFDYAEYVFDIGVAFNLAAGDYWLALHNGPLTTTDATEMLWGTTAAGTSPTGLYNDLTDAPDEGWLDNYNEHAFVISGDRVFAPPPPGDLPEPATLALVLGGLAAAGASRRRPSR